MTIQPKRNRRSAQPMTSSGDIDRIRALIKDKPRDILLFDIAVEGGIGMKRLLGLKVKDLIGINVGQRVSLESHYAKPCVFAVTSNIYETFNNYLKELEPQADDYLFKTKTGSKPLNLSTVSNMIKGWFKKADIPYCIGAISLRKTCEYNQKVKGNAQLGGMTAGHLSIFQPVSRRLTIQQTVFNELFDAIISHKIPPGSKITTAEISKAFKVSKAPVRVAMNWLEAKGFITSEKKGSFVKLLSMNEMIEILKIRLYLESAAAKLAYRICTEETLNQLESIIRRYEAADTFEERDKMNTLFHISLYGDIKMPLLISYINDLCNRLSPYVVLHLSLLHSQSNRSKDPLDTTYYHRQILEGMRHKDLSRILKFLKLKLERGEKYMMELVKHT
jgi:DNA-binding GntR family transcriptional regulator